MPDDLAFVGLEGTFGFGIKGSSQRCRIRVAFADRRPEKLENIVVPETPKPIAAGAAVLQLAERRQGQQATAGNHCDELYYVFFPKHLWIQSIVYCGRYALRKLAHLPQSANV